MSDSALQSRRRLGRALKWIATAVVIVGAVIVALRFGAPSVVLWFAFAALTGAVMLFWEALRHGLAGDESSDDEDDGGSGVPADLEDRKNSALRALRDIDFEHSIRRLSDEDHEALREKYRAEARAAMQSIDESLNRQHGAFMPRAKALVARAAGETVADVEIDGPRTQPGSGKKKKRRARLENERNDDASARVTPPFAPPASNAAPATSAGDASAVLASPFTDSASDEPSEASASEAAAGFIAPSTDDATNMADDPEADERRCPDDACATENDDDAVFCKKCGTRLGATA